MPEFTARPATKADIEIWAEMRQRLWPGYLNHLHDVQNFFTNSNDDRAVYMSVAVTAPAAPVGFIELSLRKDSATGSPIPVAYIEGWFVSELIRHAGAGKALISAAESWATHQGCKALTSECQIDNLDSASAHQACGFYEVRRNIFFSKKLN